MAFDRGIDGTDPLRAQPAIERPGPREERHAARTWQVANGTLACPSCDAPVALGGRSVRFADALDCPFCRHAAPLRDFISLAAPTRPVRVQVRAILPVRR